MAAKKKTKKTASVKKNAKPAARKNASGKSGKSSKKTVLKKTVQPVKKSKPVPASAKKIAKSVVTNKAKSNTSPKAEKKTIAPATAEKKNISASPAKTNIEKPSKKEVKAAPVIEQKPIVVANLAKTKVKTVLVSQPKPESEKSPYLELARKHNIKIDFRHFISVEGVPAKEFRSQRINILDHNAVILTSRIAIDHYFRMAAEMRITVPETMKYFCLSESIAYYLQKYVQYRKRKIFYGHQTISDLVDVIKKHKEEKFLLPVSDVHREQIADFLDELQIKYSKAIFYRTVSADLSDMKGTLEYDIIVFFTPAGIRSLRKNFPNFKQGNTRLAAFGYNTALSVNENGYRLDIFAPTPQAPSMTMALEQYIKDANKR